jgi:hypothetical protein
MTRRILSSAALLAVLLAVAGCGGGASKRAAFPSRSTPLKSTLGWFAAINAHDRRQLLSYVAPSAQDQMGWARPSVPWARFKDVRCLAAPDSSHRHPDLRCTFHEVGTVAEEGNPDTFWDVYLEHTGSGWMIDSYGQG